MIYRDIHSIADDLDAGTIDAAEAVKSLRALATFRPAENCTRMISNSRYLARVEETWNWSVITDHDNGRTQARLMSDCYTRSPGNLDTVLDFSWCEPGAVDQMGRAICEVAREMQAARDYDEDDY